MSKVPINVSRAPSIALRLVEASRHGGQAGSGRVIGADAPRRGPYTRRRRLHHGARDTGFAATRPNRADQL